MTNVTTVGTTQHIQWPSTKVTKVAKTGEKSLQNITYEKKRESAKACLVA